MHLAAPQYFSIESQRSYAFPRSALLVADALDDLAPEQQAKDAVIAAKKRAYQKAQEEKQAKEQADYEAKQAKLEAAKARVEEAKAKQAAKAAAAAEARAAKDVAKAEKDKDASSKSTKYATVQTINPRAERIAARKAAGEEA